MMDNAEILQKMVYPGRVIIVGKSPAGENVIIYAITGRSPSSQARKLETDDAEKTVFVKPTDEETLKTGNPDLLVYPAVICGNGIAVSNGKHTEDIFTNLHNNGNPLEVLIKALAEWKYEPDEPNYTPRISACITDRGAGLSLIKRAEDGTAVRSYFEIPATPGKGKMIATYTGVNENPLPSFTGEPQDIKLPWQKPEDAANAIYDAMGPKAGEPDFRVAAAAVFSSAAGDISIKVKNRNL